MSSLLTAALAGPDPDGLAEFSVVYSDRALNHMSQCFQRVMRDLSGSLRALHGADSIAIVPGSGASAMEAVVRFLLHAARRRPDVCCVAEWVVQQPVVADRRRVRAVGCRDRAEG